MKTTGKLKVGVQSDRCQGHNRCYAIAPELFEIDELGNSKARGDGAVAAALEDKARLAVKNCPEHAIRLTQEL
jgi:ferredoxin